MSIPGSHMVDLLLSCRIGCVMKQEGKFERVEPLSGGCEARAVEHVWNATS